MEGHPQMHNIPIGTMERKGKPSDLMGWSQNNIQRKTLENKTS